MGDILSVSELLFGAFAGIAVGKSNETIALLIKVQIGFMDDTDSPHERVIEATTKALTASHFQCLRSTSLIEGKPARRRVFVPFEGRVAGHI